MKRSGSSTTFQSFWALWMIEVAASIGFYQDHLGFGCARRLQSPVCALEARLAHRFGRGSRASLDVGDGLEMHSHRRSGPYDRQDIS